ncbi:GNAT family N-acetyltransferase [Sneathiella marina]|uniref:GNAT family N-acetyltransferase n=1 Tax=Sneathiella marina TaxID=2950108 RepID=A0ABY4W2Y2_9PROT|nr:GNAT family N-acetyltransferase [Sneathiella marina]USG61413.1 GNAT family N-acetyltransferase [Sneathiella marina]
MVVSTVRYRWLKSHSMPLYPCFTIRPYCASDAQQTARVFYDSVHIGAASFYSLAQRQAWAPEIPKPPLWGQRLANATTMVAVKNNRVVGFMSLTGGGMLDLAYVLPAVMGMGVAEDLYRKILEIAQDRDLVALGTEASHMARRFFLKHGWREVTEQTVERNGVELTNFLMAKYLK